VKQKVAGVHGTSDVRVELVWDPPWDRSMITESAKLQLGML
jgi:metal-sulfur cluster biosynthetic enzyme